MSSYYVEMTFTMGPQLGADFEAHLDDVAAALADIPEIDGDIGVDLARGRVDLCMTLGAVDRPDALARAVSAARAAIHTAGGNTSGWERMLTKLLDDDEYLLRSAPSAWGGLLPA